MNPVDGLLRDDLEVKKTFDIWVRFIGVIQYYPAGKNTQWFYVEWLTNILLQAASNKAKEGDSGPQNGWRKDG